MSVPDPRASELQARTSAAVGVARVFCILGVVYAHAWIGRGGADLAAAAATPQGILRLILMNSLGRSAVPLLGMVSGWLVAASVRKRSYASFVAGRARTVLAPMVLWNGLAVVLVSGAAWLGLITAPTPRSWGWLVNEIFCLAGPAEINVQTAFLRDLFVCMAAAPLLVRAPRALLLAVAATAVAWSLSGVSFPLLLRPSILLFFVIGIIARQDGLARRVGGLPLWRLAIPYLVLALASAWVNVAWGGRLAPLWTNSLDLLLRFAAGAFFWGVAWRLAVRPAGKWLLKAEPYVFLMFCSHLIMLWLAGPLIGRVTGPLGAPLYPVYLVLQPVLVLFATIALGRLLVNAAPAVAGVLSGGRLRAAPGLRLRPAQAFEGR